MRTTAQYSIPEGINPKWRVGIVYSPYYKEQMTPLVEGARECLLKAGLARENILEHPAPGSFEVPLIGKALAQSGKVDALIGLGIIVEGQTHHARLLADNASRALMDVQMEFTMPFGFEILYVNDLGQVDARLDKGVEAALAILHSLVELEKIKR